MTQLATAGPDLSDLLGDVSSVPGQGQRALAPSTAAAPAPSPYAHGGPEALGMLLDEQDEGKVAEHVERKLWKAQDKRLKQYDMQWVVNEHVRAGVTGARIISDPITGITKPYLPIGSSASKVGIPKTEQLIRKRTATLFVDPPLPEATPSTGEDADRTAAELATRILQDEASESGVNLREDAEMSCDLAATYGSAFVWAYVNPQGAGWGPMLVQAHPAATHYDDEQPDAILIDPATGEQTDTYVPRYVAPDGSLQQSAVGARRVWRAAIEHRRLTGRHVRFLPETSTGIRDAKGVVLCQVETLGHIKTQYPEVAEWSEDDIAELVSWRPASLAKILPPGIAVDGDGKAKNSDGTYSDDALCMTLTAIYQSHGTYPMGAYVCTTQKRVLHRQPWAAIVGEGDDEREEPLDVPLAQFRDHTDATGGNPYGMGAAERLGPADEIRSAQMAAWLDHLDRFNHPNTYLPIGSLIQPQMLARRDGTPILYNPEAGAPQHEQVPEFPKGAVDLYEAMGQEMNSESGLEQTAQGVDTESAASGVAKQLVVEQALTALSGTKNNIEDGLIRLCRIDLQLRRAYIDTASTLKYAGEDGGYRVREWTKADLRSVRDVRIARGSFTMLSKSAKQALARDEFSLALQTQDPGTVKSAWMRYQRGTSGIVDPLIGQEDDPHRMRVKRQIGQWLEGTEQQEQGHGAASMTPSAPGAVGGGLPPGANPPNPAPAGVGAPGGVSSPVGPPAAPAPGMSAMGMPQVDPNTGQPLPPPPDPAAVAIWAPLAVDEEPDVAQIRHEELARTMAGSKYGQLPPEWRAPFDQEYARMKLCAGIQTIPEQQAAQQQAAAQQAAQQQQQQAQQGQQQAQQKAEQQAAQQQHDASKHHAQLAHDATQSNADRQAAAAMNDKRLEQQQAAGQMRVAMQQAAKQGTALDPGANVAALVTN